jgi:hypothetical protein
MNTERSEPSVGHLDEIMLRRLITGILKAPEVHPQEAFFGLAGDSITAMRLARRACVEGLPTGIEYVFRDGTVRGLAAAAGRARANERQSRESKDREAAAERLRAAELARGIDLTRAPLIRFPLIRADALRHRPLLTYHPLVLDGWSGGLFMRGILERYDSAPAIARLPPDHGYRRYVEWLYKQDRERAEGAWREYLSDLPGPTLTAPTAPGGFQVPDGITMAVEPATAASLRQGSRSRSFTVNTVVQAAGGLVLGAACGRTDVVFGKTVAGRPAELADAEGMLANTVPVRVRTYSRESLAELAVRLQSEQAQLVPHEHLGLVEIQRAAGQQRLFEQRLRPPEVSSRPAEHGQPPGRRDARGGRRVVDPFALPDGLDGCKSGRTAGCRAQLLPRSLRPQRCRSPPRRPAPAGRACLRPGAAAGGAVRGHSRNHRTDRGAGQLLRPGWPLDARRAAAEPHPHVFGVKVPIRAIYDDPIVAGLAQSLDDTSGDPRPAARRPAATIDPTSAREQS